MEDFQRNFTRFLFAGVQALSVIFFFVTFMSILGNKHEITFFPVFASLSFLLLAFLRLSDFVLGCKTARVDHSRKRVNWIFILAIWYFAYSPEGQLLSFLFLLLLSSSKWHKQRALKLSKMSEDTSADRNVEIWKIKKLIKSLELARGWVGPLSS